MPKTLKVLIVLLWVMIGLMIANLAQSIVAPEKPKMALGEEFTYPLSVRDTIIKKAKNRHLDSGVLLAIASCEGVTQFKPDGSVVRGHVNPKDIGLFQINEYYHLEQSLELGLDIYSTGGNIDYAIWLYQQQGTKPWNWSKNCWESKI